VSALSSWTDIGAIVSELDQDYEEVTPDAHVLAYQIVYGGKKHNVDMPKSAWDLAAFITTIAVDLTRVGAPTLTVTIQDPEWVVLDSGFFFADQTGKLLDLDIQYPDGDRYWWRLHQFSPNGADRSIQLAFLPRGIAKLMGLFGPLQANRSSKTRAEFLKMLCLKVPELEFYSKELDVKQPIGSVKSPAHPGTKPSSKSPAKKAAKSKGLGANAKTLTCKGKQLTTTQTQVANIILQTGDQLAAPQKALVAAIYAAMGETSLGEDADTYGGTGGSQGPFQTMPGDYSGGHDIAGQAKGFFTGGKDFGSGGAIKCANRGDPPWMIANEVEVNAVWLHSKGDSYQGYFPGGQAGGIAEAEAIVAGGGGAGGTAGGSTTSQVAQPYYFQVGAQEDYWTAMCRLAQEVNWELVVDGDRIYYDSDQVFITQKPAAVIRRDDLTTVNWGYDWVNRAIATNLSIQILSDDPFQFAAGEVLQLENFGVAADASTASPPLPGRWLIDEITRTKGDLFSDFKLVQPTPPKPEPAPQYTSVTSSAVPGGSGTASLGDIASATPKTAEAAYAAATYLNGLKLTYTQANRTMNKNGYPQGSTNLDCSASVSWVLLAAGFPLPGNVTWGGWAPVSGDYFAGGAGGALLAGPGQYMTIYANADHVFIRIHPQGGQDMQGNTVNPFGPGFGFYPWSKGWSGAGCGPSPHAGFWQVHYQGQ
jgi:hypothetical protein